MAFLPPTGTLSAGGAVTVHGGLNRKSSPVCDARSVSHSYIGREGGMNEEADSGMDLSSGSRPGDGVQHGHQENVCQL